MSRSQLPTDPDRSAAATADHDGDPAKQRPECKEWAGRVNCPDMEEVGGGMEGERYRCKVCGSSYYLDYDEMR